MENTELQLIIDKKLLAEAEALFAEFGMDMSTAVTVYLRQVMRQKKIPFEIALNPISPTGRHLEQEDDALISALLDEILSQDA